MALIPELRIGSIVVAGIHVLVCLRVSRYGVSGNVEGERELEGYIMQWWLRVYLAGASYIPER